MRSWQWSLSYARMIKNMFRGHDLWNSPWGAIAVLALPVLLVRIIQLGLSDVWLGLFELVFSIVVLLYCLRYQPQDAWIDEISNAIEEGEQQRYQELAEKIMGKPVDSEVDLIKQVSDAQLVNANERLFAPALWFALLGPMGAVLYRISWHYSHSTEEDINSGGFADAMQRLYAILNWLPARLLVVGYAIVGSFEDVVHQWRDVYNHGIDDIEELSQAVLLQGGQAALHVERYSDSESGGYDVSAIKATRGLVLRTILAWGIVIAVITLAGWAS